MANEEDLPTMDTPTVFNISPFSSLQGSSLPQDLGPSAQDPHVPSEAFAPLPKYKAHALHAPHGRRMSIVKVQPFVHGEDLSDAKSLCWPYIPRRLLALLIVFCAFIAVTLVVGIGLGVGLSCSGKFQCVSSTQCISRSALCDGVKDCSQGEDELNCGKLCSLPLFTPCPSGQVQPVCLPNYGQDFRPGSVCWVSGWGATQSGGEVSSSLQSATVPLLSARQCARHGLSSWSVCAGYLKGGSDTCQGDSGSPLACEDSVWKLVGVASWSQGCGRRNNPGIYTSIIQALPWIQQNMEVRQDPVARLWADPSIIICWEWLPRLTG
ncbi:hypothetical protein P4O66_021368 [Electrophorus voltai]|uniref:Peptidase S1 domain-containing protein n=1 Tax=Electrophorus voltai TaxID=2609070 RepID=A0AAD9E0R8_9TELE|nr:hypothetical protein P4O66_021368 [Electrophorus voltai]